MKKRLALVLSMILALGLVACSSPAEEEEETVAASSEAATSETTASEAMADESMASESMAEEAVAEENADVEGFVVEFANASTKEITEIYVSVDPAAGYGENLLVDGATLAPMAEGAEEAPSQETTINLDSPEGTYAIKFVNADGEEFEFTNFALEDFGFFRLNEDGRYSAM